MSKVVSGIGTAGIVGLVIPAILLLVLALTTDAPKGGSPDSTGYVNYAESILNGEIFKLKPLGEISFGRAVRTPGYPLVVAFAKAVFDDVTQGVLLVHFVIGLAALFFLSMVLRPYCPPLIAGLAVVLSQYFMRAYFPVIMTEWMSFNFILILFGMIVMTLNNPSFRNLVLTACLAITAFLVRPSLAPILLVVPALILYRRKLMVKEAVYLAVTLIPVLVWMGFNYYYLGAFKLAILDGHTRYGIASMIGHADIQPGDSEELQRFITAVNEEKVPSISDEEDFVRNLNDNYHMMRVESNLFWVAYPLKDKSIGVIDFDHKYLGIYGDRVLEKHPDRYLQYVIVGMKKFLIYGSPYAVLYLLLVPLFCLFRGKCRIVTYATLLMFAIHLGQALLCAAYLFVFERYLSLTFFPYVLAVIVCAIALVFAEGWPQKLVAKSPAAVRKTLDSMLQVG